MKSLNIAFTGGVVLAAAASHAAARYVVDSDIQPVVSSGKIITNAYDDLTGTTIPNTYHFGYEFQSDPDDPYFIQDPGFEVPAASGFPAGSNVSFSVVRRLTYWSGAGPVSFTAPPNAESVQLNFGASNVFITGSSNNPGGFVISNVSSDGSFHRHLNAFLHGADANTDPTEGVYFFNIRLNSSAGGISASDSLYLIYNNGLSAPEFTSALSYLENPFAGDANFDGMVNSADFTILAGSFGGSDKFWYDGDFNGDRRVNSVDFSILAGNFGLSAPASAASAVPEPASGIFAASLLAALVVRSRRCRP